MLSNGEGLLMGIINGFGSMANRYIEDEAAVEKQRKLEEIKAQIEEQKMRTQKELELEYAPQKAKVEAGIEEDARQKRVGIVDAALEDRAVDAVQKKYTDPVMGDTPLTDDQQSVLNEGMAKNVREREDTRQGILASNKERMLAERDAGLKMDPTAVNADNRDEFNTYRESVLAKDRERLKQQYEKDERRDAETTRRNQETEKIKEENARLARERQESSSVSKLDSAINAAGQLLESAKSKATSRIPKNVLGEPIEDINAYLAKDEGVKAAEKRLQDLLERQQKALDDAEKKQKEQSGSSASGPSKAPYPDGTRGMVKGKMYVVRNGTLVPE